jgi:hypothetical protein
VSCCSANEICCDVQTDPVLGGAYPTCHDPSQSGGTCPIN